MISKIHKSYPNWQDGVTAARAYLKNNSSKYTMLFEQNRNLGDTLHLTPIIRHYRNLHPDACIAFIVSDNYKNAHEYNPHINRLFLVPSLAPTDRVSLRRKLLTFTEIDKMIAPSIFPYGSVWKALAWSHKNIADQYFHNAGINDLKLNGGRKLVVPITPADKEWAKNFLKNHSIRSKTACVLEYNSYSGQPKWRYPQFKQFVARMNAHGIKCISVARVNEKPIKGSVSACGITWRQTVALMNHAKYFVGIGSGLTMLAAAAESPPKILEIGIPDSISMKGCQYADSFTITNIDPTIVADHVKHKIK